MPDTTESTTFATCLRKHLAARLRGPRRLRAGRAADDRFVAEVLEGHLIAVRHATSDLEADRDIWKRKAGELPEKIIREAARLGEQLEAGEREASELRRELEAEREHTRTYVGSLQESATHSVQECERLKAELAEARARSAALRTELDAANTALRDALVNVSVTADSSQAAEALGRATEAARAKPAVKPEPAPRTPAEPPSAASAPAREHLRAPVAGKGEGNGGKRPGGAP